MCTKIEVILNAHKRLVSPTGPHTTYSCCIHCNAFVFFLSSPLAPHLISISPIYSLTCVRACVACVCCVRALRALRARVCVCVCACVCACACVCVACVLRVLRECYVFLDVHSPPSLFTRHASQGGSTTILWTPFSLYFLTFSNKPSPIIYFRAL